MPTLSRLLVAGIAAGLLAGLLMLVIMGLLRLLFGIATPTELIFDRLFPKLTVKFFIDQLVEAGGYTPLKLKGVFGALTGHLAVAAVGGAVYAWFVSRVDRRGWRLIFPGVMAVTVLFSALLWPNLLTHYHGLASACSILGMLLSFGVCGLALMAFFRLLYPIALEPATVPRGGVDPGRRAFLAVGIGAGLAVALGAVLRRLYTVGTFAYDGRQYSGPKVQKITPITPEDEFYQVSKNLVDPRVARSGWRLSIVGEVENPQTYRFNDLVAMPAVEQETTLQCISYGVGSGLISNARWKGVPLPALLAQARVKGTPAPCSSTRPTVTTRPSATTRPPRRQPSWPTR